MIGFVIGLFIGAIVGVVTTSMMKVAKSSDEALLRATALTPEELARLG
jgi:gas vesicle protein